MNVKKNHNVLNHVLTILSAHFVVEAQTSLLYACPDFHCADCKHHCPSGYPIDCDPTLVCAHHDRPLSARPSDSTVVAVGVDWFVCHCVLAANDRPF